MTRSKFRLWALLPATLTILVTGLLYFIFSKGIFNSIENPPTAVYVFTGVFLIVWTWLVFGELRTKAISVTLDNDLITTSNFLGLGGKRIFDLTEFDGFTTSLLPSKGGTYEYLYLIKDNKKVIKLSEFYHKNYFELKHVLSKRVKFMGNKPFNMLTELKEIYQ
jgi:hypothetical protein